MPSTLPLHRIAQVLSGHELAVDPLRTRQVALIGYGNQGRAHALNLRDSGVAVRVGGRPGSPARARATAEGFATFDTPEAVRGAELVILALPDQVHGAVWNSQLLPALLPGQTVGFLHGFSVHFGFVQVPAGIGCVLVAPKGPGTTLRARFEQGQGIPALLAVHQERAAGGAAAPGGGVTSLELAKAWAAGIGCGRAAVVPTTFRDECETDLFGEQAVLCGGMLTLARAAYETLVEAGYPPLLAYTECIQEIKQVADLLYERGPSGMRAAISDTAEFGAYTAQQALDDEALRARLRAMLARVRDGSFARDFQRDHDAGFPWFNAQRAAADAHPMEGSGRETRALTPWLRAAPTDGDANKDGTA